MRNSSNKSVFFKMSPMSNTEDGKTEISDSPVGGSFKSVLLRWRRSVYQLIWKHLLIYALTYILLSILYQFVLNEDGKKNFRVLAEHCSGYSRSINLMIMLGFFTSTTMQRLFTMQITIPGIAKSITMFILSLKPGLPEGPIIIEKYSRWQVLTWVLTFRLVCKPLRTIYPDLMSLQNAGEMKISFPVFFYSSETVKIVSFKLYFYFNKRGLLTQEEREVMENPELTSNTTPHPLIVVDWILLLLKETFLKSRYFSEINHLKNVEIIMAFKKSCGNTIKFATQNISPALIQAVILAVYGFGCITLMARNFSKEDAPISDAVVAYIPLMPGLQFFVYFAWLCFGRAAVDPFGDDEDDINVKQLVQSHIEDSMRLRDLYSRQLTDVFPKLEAPIEL
ncbi:bestrophin-4 isoform X2 [Daphnia magna]|uniref:bestrophin-4 isoform X2 n=1 Tax=Daphnia magna TaxID=35525 RepID=UPI001E1BC325|nr:bestrophin-4 isoform X2 [Daphnia magna]